MISLIIVDLPDPVPDVNKTISPLRIPSSLSLRPSRHLGYGIDLTSLRSTYASHIASPRTIAAGVYLRALKIAVISSNGLAMRESQGSLVDRDATLVMSHPIILAASATAFSPASSWSNISMTSLNERNHSRLATSIFMLDDDGSDTTG